MRLISALEKIGSGPDLYTAQVLKISRTTVSETLKKTCHFKAVNEARLAATQTIVKLFQ